MTKKRAIFEEVGSDTPTQGKPPQAGIIDAGARRGREPIRIWLTLLFALVVIMILVGGLTRLTDSGLSITEWRPVTGALPPMDAATWQSEFEKYQQIPEFQLQNNAMTLEEFKAIYWWEWGHRQLGRFIGLVWVVGFLWFWLSKRIPRGWTGRLVWIGVLGGLQGAVGWWMVSSGLRGTMLDVASYRLGTHLGLAFIILGFLYWFIMKLGHTERDLLQMRRDRNARLFGWAAVLIGMAFVQVFLGALVAGIDAGRVYADWPLMADGFLPPEPFALDPLWRNFFEDEGLVQFMHRMMAYLLMLITAVVWGMARRSGHSGTRVVFRNVLFITVLQAIIGIVTLINFAPWHLAVFHQLGAVILWVILLRARFVAGYPGRQTLGA